MARGRRTHTTSNGMDDAAILQRADSLVSPKSVKDYLDKELISRKLIKVEKLLKKYDDDHPDVAKLKKKQADYKSALLTASLTKIRGSQQQQHDEKHEDDKEDDSTYMNFSIQSPSSLRSPYHHRTPQSRHHQIPRDDAACQALLARAMDPAVKTVDLLHDSFATMSTTASPTEICDDYGNTPLQTPARTWSALLPPPPLDHEEPSEMETDDDEDDGGGVLFCKLLLLEQSSSSSSSASSRRQQQQQQQQQVQQHQHIGFVRLESSSSCAAPRDSITFADARRVMEAELVPDVLSPDMIWKFVVPTLGPVSRRQETLYGPLMNVDIEESGKNDDAIAIVRTTNGRTRRPIGSLQRPLSLVIVKCPQYKQGDNGDASIHGDPHVAPQNVSRASTMSPATADKSNKEKVETSSNIDPCGYEQWSGQHSDQAKEQHSEVNKSSQTPDEQHNQEIYLPFSGETITENEIDGSVVANDTKNHQQQSSSHEKGRDSVSKPDAALSIRTTSDHVSDDDGIKRGWTIVKPETTSSESATSPVSTEKLQADDESISRSENVQYHAVPVSRGAEPTEHEETSFLSVPVYSSLPTKEQDRHVPRDSSTSTRSSLHGYNRPECFDPTPKCKTASSCYKVKSIESPGRVSSGWKPKGKKIQELLSNLEEWTAAVTAKKATFVAGKKTESSLSVPAEGTKASSRLADVTSSHTTASSSPHSIVDSSSALTHEKWTDPTDMYTASGECAVDDSEGWKLERESSATDMGPQGEGAEFEGIVEASIVTTNMESADCYCSDDESESSMDTEMESQVGEDDHHRSAAARNYCMMKSDELPVSSNSDEQAPSQVVSDDVGTQAIAPTEDVQGLEEMKCNGFEEDLVGECGKIMGDGDDDDDEYFEEEIMEDALEQDEEPVREENLSDTEDEETVEGEEDGAVFEEEEEEEEDDEEVPVTMGDEIADENIDEHGMVPGEETSKAATVGRYEHERDEEVYTPPPPVPKLVMLVTLYSGNREIMPKQKRAISMLEACGISPELLDGSDPANRTRRNELFQVAGGRRGEYPLFFWQLGREETTAAYVGDFDTIERMKEQGSLGDILTSPQIVD